MTPGAKALSETPNIKSHRIKFRQLATLGFEQGVGKNYIGDIGLDSAKHLCK